MNGSHIFLLPYLLRRRKIVMLACLLYGCIYTVSMLCFRSIFYKQYITVTPPRRPTDLPTHVLLHLSAFYIYVILLIALLSRTLFIRTSCPSPFDFHFSFFLLQALIFLFGILKRVCPSSCWNFPRCVNSVHSSGYNRLPHSSTMSRLSWPAAEL